MRNAKIWPVILVLLLILGTGCDCVFYGKKQPIASEGIMDLRDWDFERDGPVDLAGEWMFFWQELVGKTPADIANSLHPPGYIWVPGTWNDHVVDGRALKGHGYATYRLRVLLKKGPTSPSGKNMAVLVRDMGTAYSLFINGEKKARGGAVGRTPARSIPGYWPDVADFVSEGNEADIVLHLSNYHHRKGGVWASVVLGTERDVHDLREKKLILDFFLFGSIFIMACYHLVLYSMRKKELSYLYFGLICLIISARIMVTGEYYLVRVLPSLQWKYLHMLEYLTVYASIPLFFMFLRSLFPAEFNRQVLRAYQLICIIFSCIVIATPSQTYTQIMQFFQVLSFMICVYGLYALLLSLMRKREDAVPFIIGFAVLFLSVANDFLYNNRIIRTGYAVPYGLLFFIFSQAFLLSRRFTRTFGAVEHLFEELEVKNARLMELDRLKDEFMTSVSHELRSPLHGIIGIAQSITEVQDAGMSEESRRNLGLITFSGKRLVNLIDDLSDFARLKNRDIALSRRPVDIRTISEIVIALLRPLIGSKKIEIKNDIHSSEPLLYADENRLQQILYNLIGNAVKFTNEGIISVSAEQLQRDGPAWMKISVSDTGIGIPENAHEKIFESFTQADESIPRKYGGVGIGLSIARQLVELHAGVLEVESMPGKGSTFSFSMPAYREGVHEVSAQNEEPLFYMQDRHQNGPLRQADVVKNNPSGLGGRILIIDDDIVNLQVIKNFLSAEDYSVVTAVSGMEAVELSRRGSFDCILLDLMMPERSGYDICADIRKNFSLYELPVIILTARNGIQDLVMAFDFGANDFLTKPIRKDELMARVRTLITLKKTVQAHKESKFKLLQERMNPHFLFNALNTVHALIHTDSARADTAVIKLADNYRFLIERSGRSLIPFEAEWRFVKNYLEIEELRFSDILSIRAEKNGDFAEVLIPPLTIQPLVENSLKHGIWKESGSGSVCVSAEADKERVRIRVLDNGAGLGQGDIYSRSLGNIRKRLNYHFDDIEFSILNRDTGGVEVNISYLFRNIKSSV